MNTDRIATVDPNWGGPVPRYSFTPEELSDPAARMPVPSGRPSAPLTPTGLEAAVAGSNIPTLLAMLVQLTGSREWLDERLRPQRVRGLSEDDGGGLPAEVQAEVRAAAVAAIAEWMDGKPVARPVLSAEEAHEILSFSMGEDVPAEYADYIQAELVAMAPVDGVRPEAEQSLIGMRFGVIGAGVSGIVSTIELVRRGAEVTVFERSDDFSGTWHLNRYPGCGVDTASHLYQFSFEPGDWENFYAPQNQIKEYFKQVADLYDVKRHVQFNSEVVAAEYVDADDTWVFTVRDAAGEQQHVFDAMVSGVGAFGTPAVPRIAGLDDFEGTTYHTADWPDEVELAGKRVAVIGTGASAMQLVPSVIDEVGHMTIFQRSPQWAAPFEQWHQTMSESVRSMIRSVPLYRAWYRARLGWMLNDKTHASLQVDPTWDDEGRSINAINAGHRRFFTRYMLEQLGGDEELLAKTLPSYPPFGKRMLLDNGWFRALRRDDVDLVTSGIERVVENGIITADGDLVEIDVLILATGFDVVHYLSGIDVKGRGGLSLREYWDGDDTRAYLGLTVPNFPKMFCLYGPNAAPGHGGSFINAVECQLNYLSDLMGKMRAAGATRADVKEDVYEEYNQRVDEAHGKMIWGQPNVHTYYRNSKDRVVYASPWRIVDYWHLTREADIENYELGSGQ